MEEAEAHGRIDEGSWARVPMMCHRMRAAGAAFESIAKQWLGRLCIVAQETNISAKRYVYALRILYVYVYSPGRHGCSLSVRRVVPLHV